MQTGATGRADIQTTGRAAAYLGAWALLAGCGGPEAEVSGAIGTTPFNEVATVFHAGPFLVLFDRELDCIETAWMARTYIDGTAPSEDRFVALQFAHDEETFGIGTVSVEGAAAVTAWGLVNTEAFDLMRGRTGTITLDEVSEDRLEGSFDVEFAEGAVSGTFRSEYCRNMQP